MNSLFQALSHIPQFRHVVYNMPLPYTLLNHITANNNEQQGQVEGQVDLSASTSTALASSKKDPKSINSISLALQRVFYHLQTSLQAVSTKQLTTSFGWDTADSFMQHDVQEFSRVLMDSLESTLKQSHDTDTGIDQNVMNRLFEGLSESYVKCLNVPFESNRREPFLDISL